MKFGLYTGVHDLTLKRVYADVVDELREQVVLCEEAGFECVWVDEHHFNATHTNSPNPVVFGAMLAAHTSRIRLGLANVVAGWHPLRLAEDVALLDHISKGRVDLAIGRGGEDPGLNERDITYQAVFNPHPKGVVPDPKLDVREHGLSSDQTALQKHFAEFVDILKKAWTEPFFSHQGSYYTFPQPGYPWKSSILDAESLEDPAAVKDGEVAKIRLGPKPYQQPYPPLWMYMMSETSFAEAARLGLKGMVWAQPANRLRETLETYTNIRNEVGGGQLRVGDDINVIRLAYVAPTYEEAKKEADPLFTPLFTKQFERSPNSYWYKKGEAIPTRTDMDWEFYRKQLLILAGSPEQVAEQIQELREVGGVNYITLWMEGPGLSHEKNNVEHRVIRIQSSAPLCKRQGITIKASARDCRLLNAILGLVAVAGPEGINRQNLRDGLRGSYHEGSECLSPEGLDHRRLPRYGSLVTPPMVIVASPGRMFRNRCASGPQVHTPGAA